MRDRAESRDPDGERVSFEDFCRTEQAALLRFARVVTGNRDDALDVTADVLFYAYRHWARVRRMDHPEAYLRRAITNAHLSQRRTRHRHSRAVPLLARSEIDPTDIAATHSDVDAITAALSQLAPRDRLALLLRYLLDLDDDAVAAEIGVEPQTVRVVMFRARERLRTALEPRTSRQHQEPTP